MMYREKGFISNVCFLTQMVAPQSPQSWTLWLAYMRSLLWGKCFKHSDHLYRSAVNEAVFKKQTLNTWKINLLHS